MHNPIKPTIKTEILPMIIILASIVLSVYFYFNLPERVPAHWNFAGEVDRYGSKLEGSFLIPAIMLGMYIMFLALPLIDPKKDRYAQFRKVYHVFKAVMLLSMLLLFIATGLSGLGYNVSIGLWAPAFVGILFIIIGNYLGKIKANWFMGIRTPWTLSSEQVWNKTHRLGGKSFIVAGLAIALMNFYPLSWRLPLFVAAIIVAAILPIVYSYLLYIKEEKRKQTNYDGNN